MTGGSALRKTTCLGAGPRGRDVAVFSSRAQPVSRVGRKLGGTDIYFRQSCRIRDQTLLAVPLRWTMHTGVRVCRAQMVRDIPTLKLLVAIQRVKPGDSSFPAFAPERLPSFLPVSLRCGSSHHL